MAEGPPHRGAGLLLREPYAVGKPLAESHHPESGPFPTVEGLAWGLVGVSVRGGVGAVIYDVLHK